MPDAITNEAKSSERTPSTPPGRYDIVDGILYKRIPVSESVFHPTRSLHDISTDTRYTELAFSTGNGILTKRRLKDSDVSKKAELLSLNDFGANLNDEEASRLSKDLLKASREIHKVERIASRTGWYGDELVLPGGRLELAGFDTRDWLAQKDKEAYRATLKEVISWRTTSLLIALSAGAVAPLVEKLNVQRKPVIALSSESNTGKTTSTNFAQSLWCRPSEANLDFESTTILALLQVIQKYNGLPIALQDVQNFDDETLKGIPYVLASGRERMRLDSTYSVAHRTRWQGTALLTGEYSMLRDAMKVGAVNRFLELQGPPLGALGVEGERRKALLDETVEQHYAALREELVALLEDGELIRGLFANYKLVAKRLGSSSDISELAALIAVGTHLLTQLAQLNDEQLVNNVIAYIVQAASATRDAGGSPGKTVAENIKNVLEQRYEPSSTVIKDDKGTILACQVQDRELGPIWYFDSSHLLLSKYLTGSSTFKAIQEELGRADVLKVKEKNGRKVYKHSFSHPKGGRPVWPALRIELGKDGTETD